MQSNTSDKYYFSKSDYLQKTKKYVQTNAVFQPKTNYIKTTSIENVENIDILYNLSSFPNDIEKVYIFGSDVHRVANELEKLGFEKTSTPYISIKDSIIYFMFNLNSRHEFIINTLLYLSIIFVYGLTIFYAKSFNDLLKVSLYCGATVKKSIF